MILFLELFTFIILLNFEVLRKVTFMIFIFYFFIGFRNHYFYLSSKLCKFLESLNGRFFVLSGGKFIMNLKSATYWVSWDFACKRQKFILLYIFLA